MTHSGIELEAVRGRIAECEKHVRLQRDILGHLRDVGAATEIAEQILTEFEARLAQERELEARLQESVPSPPMPEAS